ncbi:MAG: Proline-tRNA ligase [candidate division CPR2 bacterium GW2011_GWC2_39_10]|uniref:Proline--tRNA ligase n=1 Tax=candidate division CPR2 bacterium GW2011_GWC2_39_10 TaxID=1618345 RepID=A0A0G0LTJ4_UNCC2|nr:MAG: Proline-tRNA ligase [candidate division CPR2 bacterium GW2011_GWC2_39_10]
MKQSSLFSKTRKDVSAESDSINHRLLVKGGFISQLMSGVYTYLPLGLRVLKKIENIIREEMEKIGGQEILMPALHPKENWEVTGRWDTMDDLYKFKSHYTKIELALGPTHEEVVVPLAKQFIHSYKDLPKNLYQIQVKFRDEMRAKSGVLRGREFLMKDLYSFNATEKDLDDYYDAMINVYNNIYKRAGIGSKTYLTFASGGSFSKYSHEFQTETPAGEDIIYLCSKCKIAVNKEIIEEQKNCPKCGNEELKEVKAIEVGNIFKLKTKFSDAFNLTFTDKAGKEHLVQMGCYGIGISRLLGTIVEINHDENGIIWPKEVAPFDIHLLSLSADEKSNKIYETLKNAGFDVLLDDRDETAGTKFKDADLIGIPIRLIISQKLERTGNIEVKERLESESLIINEKDLISHLKRP